MFARVFNEKGLGVAAAQPRRRRAYRLLAANPVPWEPRKQRHRWRLFWEFVVAFAEAVGWLFSARIVRHIAPGVAPLERWEIENEVVKVQLRNF